ncbi:hypothetical protein TGME49_266720 [Toxoplasma gondii ME49]|uniref:Uncharacterized protein n=1 Tax=Toxoplasma gondii (strain ATCC 50611 / Me49) TaxID=508771 RepID=S8EW06_TOXGM|nr:hypothetical protein TGME49_266720 [Toxoplasma gondii ME49]EPT27641.1 hypothetical protein TGME49_266720 [Toxoplasma gondii ME49]|eukprot:XP_002368751.1 hypothetical protein TGME49_266720 [Toxoplasma gondii ME49]
MPLASCGYYAVQIRISIKIKRRLNALQHALSVALILERLFNAPSQLSVTCVRVTVFAVPDAFAGIARLFHHWLLPLQISMGPCLPLLVTWREIPHLAAEMPKSGSIEGITVRFGGSISFRFMDCPYVLVAVCLENCRRSTSVVDFTNQKKHHNSYLLLLDPYFVLNLGVQVVSVVFCWQAMQALQCRVAETARLEQQKPK